MKRMIWTLAAALMTVAAVHAQDAVPAPDTCPLCGRVGPVGPVWQSQAQADLRQAVREANWELYRLMNTEPVDEAAVAAQQARVDELRQEMWAQRDLERQQMQQTRPGQGFGRGNGPFGQGRGQGFGRGYGRGGGQRAGWGRGFGRGPNAW